MSMPKVRTYFGGAAGGGPLKPYHTDVVADLRVTSPLYYLEIPTDLDGDFPTHCAMVVKQDNPSYSSQFSGNLTLTQCNGTNGAARTTAFNYDGSARNYAKASAGMSAETAVITIVPGVSHIAYQYPTAGDPGSAVPGTIEIYFWKETR